MSLDYPPPVSHPYKPGVDIDIIACRRPPMEGDKRNIFAVRWAVRPDEPFPRNGFSVFRLHENNEPRHQLYENIRLPGLRFDRSGWNIDPGHILVDARPRRPPAPAGEPPVGPYFPDQHIDELVAFGPLLAFAAQEVDIAYRYTVLAALSELSGSPHESDDSLVSAFWPTGKPPDIAEILKGAAVTASQPEKNRLEAVMRFYVEFAKRFLLAFAVRFEFAKFLGLGLDDRLPDGLLGRTRIKYSLVVDETEATTDWLDGSTPCSPAPPINLRTERRVANVVEHPLLLTFRKGGPDEWPARGQTVPDFSPGDHYPKLPGYTVRLFWDEPPQVDRSRLLSFAPVLYQVERYAHGAASAAAKEPELPAGATFDVLQGAERLPLAAKKPQPQPQVPAWIDAAVLPEPLEGWYRYRVRGVDLLGVVGEYVETSVLVQDDLPPCAPGIDALEQPVLSLDKSGRLKIPLSLAWNAPEEFQGADAQTFRFAGTWKPRASRSVTVLAVMDATSANQSDQLDPLGNVQADVLLGDPSTGDTAIARDVGSTFAGGRLATPAGEFIILPDEPRAQSTVRVRKSAGRSPPLADAVVHLSDKERSAGFITYVSRTPPTVLIATLSSLSPFELALSSVSGASAPKEVATLYLHALGQTFAATLNQSGTWRIVPPEENRNDPRENTLGELWIMGEAAAAAFINGSPVLAFPKHATEIAVLAPGTFWSGSFELRVTTGDGTAYRQCNDDSGLTGNVSPPRIANIPVRRSDAPARPVSQARGILWAKPAALYKENALYTLTWPAVPGASRYEVERVLEGHFGYPPGTLSDEELVKHAIEQPKLFERRSNHVFANRYTDSLPGRAPTRALYHVRAISMGEVSGEWSEPIGPVRVPDFRIPSPPNLIRASSADTAGRVLDRKLLLEWTQSGPLDDLGFIVEAQKDLEQLDWQVIAEFIPGQLTAVGNARFVAELNDQVPGRSIRLRIVAIRHALDPIDPWGQLRTLIRGREGNEIIACATGDMRKPTSFAVTPLDNRRVELRWSNRDEYRWIEIRRVGPNSFSRIKCLGTDQRYIDVVPAAPPGEWKYELRAIGYNRNVRLDEVVVAL